MRTIEVEDDVYVYIAQNTQEIGEPASNILRRLLRLPNGAALTSGHDKPAQDHEFTAVMTSPRFLMQTAAVDKFLYFLGVAFSQKKSDFEKVLEIQGRDRKYFAKSEEEVEKSGNSTQPRNIPGTSYWVMTNSPTAQKRQMLRDALKLLGYSDAAISAATSTIR